MKIKRIIASVLAIMMIVSVAVVTASAADNGVLGITVHYYCEEGTPTVYYWNSLPDNIETEYPGVKTLSPPSRTMPSMPETVTSPKTVDEDHDMSPEMPHERRPVPDTAVPPPNVNVSPGLAVPTRPPSDNLSV